MAKFNRFETLRKNINDYNVERTIKFLESCSSPEQLEYLHDLKRNQLLNIKTPSEFESKLNFIIELNKKNQSFNLELELNHYFLFIEKIFLLMKEFFDSFNKLYEKLEEDGKSKYFLAYLLAYYKGLSDEINQSVVSIRAKNEKKKVFDTRVSIPIENKDGHLTDIDSQLEFNAEFFKTNMSFYKFRSGKAYDNRILPIDSSAEVVQKAILEIMKMSDMEIAMSFNSWRNGIEILDLVNLFDWNILITNKSQQMVFHIKPKKSIMNEYINNLFGLHIYSHLKHLRNFYPYLSLIGIYSKQKNIKQIINTEFEYIRDVFENEYYINKNIFNKIHEGFSFEKYTKFFLLIRAYYHYYIESDTPSSLYSFPLELIVNWYSKHLDLFNFNKQKEEGIFLLNAINFYTNDSNDLFNYPLLKLDDMNYVATENIMSANLPRMFLERIEGIVPAKDLEEKGLLLESGLLADNHKLSLRGIQIQKNIKLKQGKKVVGEIDILLYDGTDILIVELKNQKIFNTEKERYLRKTSLKKEGTQQIKNAKKFLLQNQSQMSKELKIDLSNIRNIIPIVATTLDRFNNNRINDVLIISTYMLKLYFEYSNLTLKEGNETHNKIIQRMFFNDSRVTIEEFISFIEKNKLIKLIEFFSNQKISNASMFNNHEILFKRTALCQKS